MLYWMEIYAAWESNIGKVTVRQFDTKRLHESIIDIDNASRKGRFPLGGIFRAEWYFLLSFRQLVF